MKAYFELHDVDSGLDLRRMGRVDYGDGIYPKLLAQIGGKPKKLFYMGDFSLCEGPCVAIVGSRHASAYGKWAAFELAKKLAQSGAVVVSGMAAGVDSYAHQGALSVGGKTIAVLGGGLGLCYPKTNLGLMAEIAEKGLLLSEYEEDVHPTAFTFPQRNRIISGLSLATAVIEASTKSGSLITAEKAMEQGRAVYALPGNINSLYSMGTNKLIRDGAMPLVLLDDLTQDLKLGGKRRKKAEPALSADEELLLSLIREAGEADADYLARRSERAVGTVSALLTVLEMKGLIGYEGGKAFLC